MAVVVPFHSKTKQKRILPNPDDETGLFSSGEIRCDEKGIGPGMIVVPESREKKMIAS
jgi:hypothetical protein